MKALRLVSSSFLPSRRRLLHLHWRKLHRRCCAPTPRPATASGRASHRQSGTRSKGSFHLQNLAFPNPPGTAWGNEARKCQKSYPRNLSLLRVGNGGGREYSERCNNHTKHPPKFAMDVHDFTPNLGATQKSRSMICRGAG